MSYRDRIWDKKIEDKDTVWMLKDIEMMESKYVSFSRTVRDSISDVRKDMQLHLDKKPLVIWREVERPVDRLVIRQLAVFLLVAIIGLGWWVL